MVFVFMRGAVVIIVIVAIDIICLIIPATTISAIIMIIPSSSFISVPIVVVPIGVIVFPISHGRSSWILVVPMVVVLPWWIRSAT